MYKRIVLTAKTIQMETIDEKDSNTNTNNSIEILFHCKASANHVKKGPFPEKLKVSSLNKAKNGANFGILLESYSKMQTFTANLHSFTIKRELNSHKWRINTENIESAHSSC